MEDRYLEGFRLIRAWYPSHLRRLRHLGRRPEVAERLWDLLVDALLGVVKHYDGRIKFESYLGTAALHARRQTIKWARRERRASAAPWPVNSDGEPFDPPAPVGCARWAEVAPLVTAAELDDVYAWAERRVAPFARGRGRGAQARRQENRIPVTAVAARARRRTATKGRPWPTRS